MGQCRDHGKASFHTLLGIHGQASFRALLSAHVKLRFTRCCQHTCLDAEDCAGLYGKDATVNWSIFFPDVAARTPVLKSKKGKRHTVPNAS